MQIVFLIVITLNCITEKDKIFKEEKIVKNGIKSLATWLIIGIILVVVISSIIDNLNSKMTSSVLIENI